MHGIYLLWLLSVGLDVLQLLFTSKGPVSPVLKTIFFIALLALVRAVCQGLPYCDSFLNFKKCGLKMSIYGHALGRRTKKLRICWKMRWPFHKKEFYRSPRPKGSK